MPKPYIPIALTAVISLIVVTPSPAQRFTLLTSLPPPPLSVALIYDPGSGDYTLHAGEGLQFTTWEHKSAAGMFIPDGLTETEPPTKLAGLFDVLSETKLFKLDPAGFSQLEFGPILPRGLSFDEINDDTQVSGSFQR